MTSLTTNILHAAYPGPHAVKRIARDCGAPLKTVEKWWGGITEMRASAFIRLAQSNATMRAELLKRLENHGYSEPAGVAGAGVERGVGAARGLVRSTAPAFEAHALRVTRGRGK